MFDCEHALAIQQVDLFYTYDDELASIARKVAKRVAGRTIAVCANAGELRRTPRRRGITMPD